jgi:predicted Zn-dependent protease
MELKTWKSNDKTYTIEFAKQEFTIGNYTIPERYVNATQLCQTHGKWLKNWHKADKTKRFIEALVSAAPFGAAETIIQIKLVGSQQSTWVHPKIAINIAQWISPEFDLWVADQIESLIFEGHVELMASKDKQLAGKDKQLAERDQRVEELELQTLQLTNYVTNVKIRTQHQYFYIVSTDQYSNKNNFKLGHTDNLKARLSQYNTGQVSTDLFKYCYHRKVYDGKKIDKLMQDLLCDFKETTNKENIILHFTYLRRIVDFVIDHWNETYDFLNEFIKNDLAKTYTLRPLKIEWLTLEPTITTNGDTILLSEMDEAGIKELLMCIIESSRNQSMTRKAILDALVEKNYKVKGFCNQLWDKMKEIAREKRLIIKY